MHAPDCLCSRRNVLLHQRYCNRGPLKQWMDWKQRLTSTRSSVLPFLLSSLMPRTNLIDDFSITFLTLSADDKDKRCCLKSWALCDGEFWQKPTSFSVCSYFLKMPSLLTHFQSMLMPSRVFNWLSFPPDIHSFHSFQHRIRKSTFDVIHHR